MNAGAQPSAATSDGSIELAVVAPDVSSVTTTSAVTTTTTTVVTTTTEPPVRQWTLMAGGDVLMDRSEAAGVDPFAGMVPALATADIAVVNVEMAITSRGVPVQKTFVFRAPASAVSTMAAAGVDVANLANNHARDYGEEGLLDTLEALEGGGILAVGAGAIDSDAYRHRIVEVPGGPTVAFLGASQIMPSGFAASGSRPGIADGTNQRERVLANVRVAAQEADVVVVAVHWGIERDTCPSGTQRSFAQALLDAGATAVLGHHPHVLQPVVTTETQLVAYSLGNFVWHPRSGITGDTGILQLDFEDERLVGWKFHPHLLDSRGAPTPVADGSRHQRIVDIISGDCAQHDPPPVTTAPLTSVTTAPPSDTSPPAASTTTPPATTTAPPVPTTAAPPGPDTSS